MGASQAVPTVAVTGQSGVNAASSSAEGNGGGGRPGPPTQSNAWPADATRTAAGAASMAGNGTRTALVPSPGLPEVDEIDPGFGPSVVKLPVEVDVAVPIRDFRVSHLLALRPGTVIESRWNHGNDLPLAAGDVTLAWTEFEVIETCLAVRVTRLAEEKGSSF